MNRGTRMLLMGGGKNRRMDEGRGRDYRERDRDYDRHHERERMDRRMDYEPEGRFRDSRGREHYDNGRYAPARSEYDGYTGVEYGYMGYHTPPYVPPIYEAEERRRMPMDTRMRMGGREYYDEPRMNRIGFSLDGEMNRLPDDDERRDHMGRSHMDHERMNVPTQLTRESAMEWTGDMINADGTRGPHWSMEQVQKVMEQRGMLPEYDKLTFYAILNAVYSDYCAVAKRYGVGDKIDFYVDMARAWIDDQDAKENKAARYFSYIVKH